MGSDMVRKSIFLILIAFAVLFLNGCGAANDVQELPTLVIGCEAYRPYYYINDDGEPAGLNVDVAAEVCGRMGYEPVYKEIDWNDRDALLKSGEIDCLWNCIAVDGQEERYAWVPYMNSRQVVAVLNDSPIVDLSDLEGKSVAVRVSTKAEQTFLEHSEDGVPVVSNVYCLTSMDDVVTALRNHFVDACAGYAAAVTEQLEADGVDYRLLDEDLSQAKLGVAFSKDGDSHVRELLSDALDEMRSDGSLKEILSKYVDADKALGGIE